MNPAYDLTYRLDRFEYGAVQRIPAVEQRVGGKGINVARVLRALGHDTVAMGFADTAFGREAAREMPVDFVEALPRVRRTVVLSEADGTTTGLWEPGAALHDPRAADQLKQRVAERLPRARGLVVSGSLPGGVDPALPAELAELAVRADVPVICDVDGEALRAAAKVWGVVLMPNDDELFTLTGVRPDDPSELVESVQHLLKSGVAAIVATRGRDGLVGVIRGAGWVVGTTEQITGNPTGAGDAAAAALIAGLAAPPRGASELDWPALLTDVVATSAAAVARPVAGEIDDTLRTRLTPTIRVMPLHTWLY
ncbi:hexose kinase [Nocardia sp. SYP-A9097]|nr:hexose kinase [Nocardia sp. SYP-A9097]